MMRSIYFLALLLILSGLVAGGCGGSVRDPGRAQASFGQPVDASQAIPAPAVVAEDSLYMGRALALDGRIASVFPDGCGLWMETGDRASVAVRAPRSVDGTCSWHVSPEIDGFVVAAGTLRTVADTLSLTANGVRVTPVRMEGSNSPS